MSTLKLCRILDKVKPNGIGQTKALRMLLYTQAEALHYLWIDKGATTLAQYTFPSRIECVHPRRGYMVD